ncbi:hypothetical protein E6P97_03915 [Patescibacteria group bacterium]|nr:MAG: hypothetical protein E6P97_03915 [Patescibacteria group bacterium]
MLVFVKHRSKICGKLIMHGVILLVLSVTILPEVASAQVLPDEVTGDGAYVRCGPDNEQSYTTIVADLPAGSLYLKTNATGLSSKITMYLQRNGGDCQRVGTVTANDKTWTKVTALRPEVAADELTVTLSSESLGADIYASVATILVVPPGSCKVTTDCTGTLQNERGVIEPVTVSLPSEFVTVQTVPNLASEKIMYVEYYDNGEFLYTTPDIRPVDQNYLRGGTRTVKKVVYLTNNRLFTISDTIARPSDPLYSQYLKSTFYRLGSQARAVVTIIGIAGVGLIISYLIRRLHAWRTYRSGHGIDNYLKSH